MDFHGVKIALICNDKLLLQLRDDKPGLFNANMWDFTGGGRDGEENPLECAAREVMEGLEIKLVPDSVTWEKWYPAQKDPSQQAVFMVAKITQSDIDSVVLHEGQDWRMFDQEEFFANDQVIPLIKTRFKDYLDENA